MNRPRIGLDLDGVCYQWDKTARYMLRNIIDPFDLALGARKKLATESTSWDYIQEAVGPGAWRWLWTEGVRLGLFRFGHVVTGFPEGVRALNEFADVEIITHRPASAVMDTIDWIRINFQDFPPAGIHLLTHQEPKAEVRPAMDLYIDDKPQNCVELAEVGKVIMFARRWNEFPSLDQTRIPRVHGWLGWGGVVETARKMLND